RRDFKPFGEQIAADPTSEMTAPLRFASMERDVASTGLDYDHARFHAAPVGRFLSPDRLQGRVANPQTWNRYNYAGNNPIKYVDRTGLDYVLSGCGKGGNDDLCNQQKSMLKQSVGNAAYAHLRVDKQGKVSILGSASDFAAFGTYQRGLAALVASKSTFSLVTEHSGRTAQHRGALFEPTKGGGGSIVVDPSAFPHPTGDVMGTAITSMVHETGHALGTLFPELAAKLNNAAPTVAGYWARESYPVSFEDRYRRDVGLDIRLIYLDDARAQDVNVDLTTELVPTITPR
ncbi:MAG: RHS repeat-associated core domain-containing protein, partial [Candidatus Methylomirabilis sp.]